MINILKLRKIEKEKKLQETNEAADQVPEEAAAENVDEKIIKEIAEEMNSVPDYLEKEERNPSEELLSVTHEIEEVDPSAEIQEFASTVVSEAEEEVADPWIYTKEVQDKESENFSMTEDLIQESQAEKEELKEVEIDPAEAFRQALIAEVLRDESMITRDQLREEEEMMNKPKAETPSAKAPAETVTAQQAPEASPALAKAEEKKPEVKKAESVQPKTQAAQDAKAQDAKAHEGVVQLVGFTLGKECYGVDIKRIKEINRMTEITRVPRAPQFIEGVINLRGSVIPVINLRKKVKMPAREYDKDTRIIIVELSGKTIGFIVDAVKEVLRIPESLLVPPPTIAVGKTADYITSVAKVEDELVILLDPDKVLSREETQKLEESKK